MKTSHILLLASATYLGIGIYRNRGLTASPPATHPGPPNLVGGAINIALWPIPFFRDLTDRPAPVQGRLP